MPQELIGIVPYMQENEGRRRRWQYITEGLDDRKRVLCEVLLDNQNETLTRRSKTNPLFEDVVTTSNVLAFTTFAFPLVRRIFPRLIANDLVSVQPMSQPTGKIFYFDVLYSPALVGSPLAYNRVDLPANFSASYASAAEAAVVPQLSLQIESVDVSAITKKLSAKWSMESEQDLFAYHGLNAENELMTATGDEIAREIDRDIIAALFAFAGAGNVTWHSTVPLTGPYSLIDPKAYNRTIMDAITDANNLIFKKRYRNANWIVVGTTTAARLEKLDEFRLFPGSRPGRDDRVRPAPVRHDQWPLDALQRPVARRCRPRRRWRGWRRSHVARLQGHDSVRHWLCLRCAQYPTFEPLRRYRPHALKVPAVMARLA